MRIFINFIFTLFLGLCVLPEFVNGIAPEQEPLIQRADFTYIGAFSMSTAEIGTSRFGYSGAAVTYYKDPSTGKHTLFMEGHNWYPGNVAQIEVPPDSMLVKTTTYSSMHRATVLQAFADVTDGHIQTDIGYMSRLYGMLPYNGRLIVTAASFYDGACAQVNSHGVSGFNLSLDNDFQGFFAMDAVANPRSVAAHMTTIPLEWQPLLGGPALSGGQALSILSCSTGGPAATVFDPDDVGVRDTIPGTTVVFYPNDHKLEDCQIGDTCDLFNWSSVFCGIAFPPGSRSVLFFGSHGIGEFCYDHPPEIVCYDPVLGGKGSHAYPYVHRIWAYDANDLLQVKNGAKQCWEIRPYGVWTMDEMCSDGSCTMTGAGYDPETGRLYITDRQAEEPHVHVYQIAVPGNSRIARAVVSGANAVMSVLPNPFNPRTRISVSGIGADNTCEMSIYGFNGTLIEKRVANGAQLAHGIMWNAEHRPSGIYIVKVALQGKTMTKQVFLLK
ncbi:MAG: hypothetical protein A2487_05935 [Candidatus Raymondbacteria bacterium RifOxyC12_full_50_8]|uniref:Secretion system C-terminal sorting domain-containing protein n=1 Tax=Candidatus Raymondbacteria bacterium RIFOXYD12_FULL_49_13 TaxID=1817890 RepID=A0A1F7F3G4_UNCRA|nr:MAG: hypothetical protein A2248_10055 [Candidatus Raymondbacteria bacterium RIFOXYA2_FULL_49_16]OGJ86194.1 MAG: hypothetical protein A2350_18780 [Candidatus Raymondbacteria bacterium RifOxyB12_full_50_8]OGJ93557.1 MAG: hypothetical protein A2487_05935 [Candidatus Raymondbacteria bacterium RifOxyC12_full_50_8]OGK01102.1 MAG: hypothetical protein A2519_20305 [Candidatus Raymondbacteria bacterium RIFOXYD12_FULL_49_13]OGP39312.1 MAG: hypothetical protein A2324_02435 [Candidatus Raymondbacteria b